MEFGIGSWAAGRDLPDAMLSEIDRINIDGAIRYQRYRIINPVSFDFHLTIDGTRRSSFSFFLG